MPLVDQNVKKVEETVFEPNSFDFNNKKNEKQIKPNLNLLGYKGLTKDKYSYVVTKQGWYAEMVLTNGQSVKNLTYMLSKMVVDDAGKFWRSLEVGTNITHLAYSFRENTTQQQEFWDIRLQRLQNELTQAISEHQRFQIQKRMNMLTDQLTVQRRVEQKLWSREYLMIVFAETKEQLRDLMVTLKTSANNGTAPYRFTEMSKREKEERLYTLNNPSQYLEGQHEQD
jgi:hypothetical protein